MLRAFSRTAACLVLAVVLFSAGPAQAQKLTVVGYNVESGGAQADTIAERVREFKGEDLWGFSEVANKKWADQFALAAKDPNSKQDFKVVFGTTGGGDRMAIVYNATRLELLGQSELHQFNPGAWRSPLVAHFKLKDNNQEFLFMVNHLARGASAQRHKQAKGLNEWVQNQPHPVIAVGDYNFDFNTRKEGNKFKGDLGDRDEGLDLMTAGGHFKWVRPTEIVPTNASSHKSVLDFVFVSGKAQQWKATSTIVVKPGDFPDDNQTSDHRPVQAEFDLGAGGGAVREALERRITELELQIEQLRKELKKLDQP